MAQVTPAQVSFNGGELSARLSARIDQSIYSIGLASMVGFAALVEGPAEAMPGTIHVLQAPGPCRLVACEYGATQGHVLELSHHLVRVFTNDAMIAQAASPYSFGEVEQLTFHQSQDVLYCFARSQAPQEFRRDGAEAFSFSAMAFADGPFEPRNTDQRITVRATGVEGAVQLQAQAVAGADTGIFAPGDVGGLLRMEVTDFGDITAWEPYTTVTLGQLLTANERVYRVVGGNGGTPIRTGTLTPVHTEGVEWDGIAKGNDVNEKPAGGVRLEYLHDRFGVLRITGFTSTSEVDAEVLRRLPFSTASAGSYATHPGNYWDASYEDYTPPEVAVTYAYGTHRWSFGAFSDRRGWPQAGCVWNERLVLAKDTTLYASVSRDLNSFAELNETGEASNDMAVIAVLDDPNPILSLVPGDRLQVLTAGGVHAVGAASAAQGFGPTNVRADRQHSVGAAASAPVQIDGRTLHIDRSRSRIYETSMDAARQVQAPLDLTRYARQMGQSSLVELAAQQHPFNHIWGVRQDGQLVMAAYLPEEQVLGFAFRSMADGMAARSICSITDPAGQFSQLWLAVQIGAAWHIMRMAPWREVGELDPTPCMVDCGAAYEGAPQANHTHPVLRSGQLHVVADGAFYALPCDEAGRFTLPTAAAKVWAGAPFPAHMESLDLEMGGDNGAARARVASIKRSWVQLENTQGLTFGTPGDMRPIEELQGGSVTDAAFAAFSGYKLREALGSSTRHPRLRIERTAPFQATVLAWGGLLDMGQH